MKTKTCKEQSKCASLSGPLRDVGCFIGLRHLKSSPMSTSGNHWAPVMPDFKLPAG